MRPRLEENRRDKFGVYDTFAQAWVEGGTYPTKTAAISATAAHNRAYIAAREPIPVEGERT